MPKPRVKGRSSERIARTLLEKQGWVVLETNKTVMVGDADAFEVDMIAVDPAGDKYCVEVKTGRSGVSDVRHVFANSEVLGLKPALVCKGFADDAAAAVAQELEVRMVSLSEFYLLLEPEELEIVVETAMRRILSEYGLYPMLPWETISEKEWEVITAIAKADTFSEVAHSLDLDAEELGELLGQMRAREIFPKGGQSFSDLKKHSAQLIQRYSLVQRLERIENQLKQLEKGE